MARRLISTNILAICVLSLSVTPSMATWWTAETLESSLEARATDMATLTTSTPTSSVSPASSTETPVSLAGHCNAFPATAVLAGFFPGLFLGALLAVLVIICLGHRRRGQRESGDFGRVSATVSDPIYHEGTATRTDFLRRASKNKYRSSRVRSLFSRSPSVAKHPMPEPKEMKTPESRTGLRKEPSMESIKIYSPPDGRLDREPMPDESRPQTTFTDMMETAGFRHNEPYLGSPGRVDPRSRVAHKGM
ncbi:hypothetical protein MMC09_006905 [Bachmanniomyces sp. S44760]|nr:hypothetical protein [Bachmanniomyces sp. S44760]